VGALVGMSADCYLEGHLSLSAPSSSPLLVFSLVPWNGLSAALRLIVVGFGVLEAGSTLSLGLICLFMANCAVLSHKATWGEARER
jgi:hypothetical protein